MSTENTPIGGPWEGSIKNLGNFPRTEDRMSADKWLESQCNRYVNGQCRTLRCMVRGGWSREYLTDGDFATCEAYEAREELRTLRIKCAASATAEPATGRDTTSVA